jgi:hypothetical protein
MLVEFFYKQSTLVKSHIAQTPKVPCFSPVPIRLNLGQEISFAWSYKWKPMLGLLRLSLSLSGFVPTLWRALKLNQGCMLIPAGSFLLGLREKKAGDKFRENFSPKPQEPMVSPKLVSLM